MMLFQKALNILTLSIIYGTISCQNGKYQYKWDNKRPVTWHYQNQQYPRMGEEYSNITNCIRVAMKVWQHNANLLLQEKEDNSADILIDFYRRIHSDKRNFDGKGGVVAHAFPPRSSGIGGDIHLDQDENWDFSCNKKDKRSHKISFLYTFLHELGHSLGLYHINNRNSVMIAYYPFKFSIENNMNFFEVDVNEIAQIYGRKESQILIPRREAAKTITTAITTSTSRSSITSRSANLKTTRTPVEEDEARHPCGTACSNKLCEVSYDTVALFRDETWIFKGSNMWKIDSHETMFMPINFMFQGMENVTKIDALFIDHAIHAIHIFVGREVYTFSISKKLKLIRKQNFKQLNYDDEISRIKGVIQHNSSIYAIFNNKSHRIDANLRALSSYQLPNSSENKFRNLAKLKYETLTQERHVIYLLNGYKFYEINEATMTLKADNNKMMSVHQTFGKCETLMTNSKSPNLRLNSVMILITIAFTLSASWS